MSASFDFSRAVAETDLARGRLLLRYLRSTGATVLYAPEDGHYYVSRGGAWDAVTGEALRPVAHQLHDQLTTASGERRRHDRAADPLGSSPTGPTALEKTAKAFANTSTIDKALRELRVQPGVPVSLSTFDTDPDLLGVRNGVVDLRTGELRPYSTEDRITKVVDVDFDPAALAPRWDAFLAQTFVDERGQTDPELVAFVHRLIGYGVTGHTREQRLPVLVGEGGTGKGTFINTLATVFAAHTETAAFESFEARSKDRPTEDLARLRGARLVMASEGTQGAPMAEAVLKRITGGDPITARHLFQASVTYDPTFLVLLATNHRPEFAGNDSGIWRRVLLVPFLAKTPPEARDDKLAEALRAEAAGILAWAVSGAVQWYQRGLQVPDSVSTATEEYRQESHPLAEFMAECCEITGEYADLVSLKDFHRRYADWAVVSNGTSLGSKQLKTLAVSLDGITDWKRHSAVVLRGVRLLSPTEQAARAAALTRPLALAG